MVVNIDPKASADVTTQPTNGGKTSLAQPAIERKRKV